MERFFEMHKSDIIYIAVVIAIVAILYFSTRISFSWLKKNITKKIPGAPLNAITLIRSILIVLWWGLGLIAVSFVFINVDKEALFKGYFRGYSYLGLVALMTVIGIAVSNLWFKHKIRERLKNNDDPTNFKFSRYIVAILIGFIGILFASLVFPSLKGVVQTALGGAGILALIIGFAAQETLANVTGGMFIIAFKPFKIGDRVMVSDTMVGTVTDITLRHTVIRNFENKMIVIPNVVINKEKLINYDLGGHKLCELIEIGISYDSDVDLAKKIMQEECENHPLIIDNRSLFDKEVKKPIVRTALIGLNDFSITIRAWAWVENHSDSFSLKCDVLESIKKRFSNEGIEIPYPYRTVVMKKTKAEIDQKLQIDNQDPEITVH